MKAKILDEAIRLVWESLESHLPYTYQKSPEGTAFHIKCVQEYTHLISLLTKLY